MACVINYNNKTYSLEDFKNILLQDPSLVKEVVNKSQERLKSIQEVFNSNPELSRVGDVFSYAIYLDTIFPDSKVKDIVYHGSAQKIKQFEIRKEPLIHFGTKNAALQRGNVLNQVLLNVEDLQTIKDGMWFLGTDEGGLLKELLDRKILTIEQVRSINSAKNDAIQNSYSDHHGDRRSEGEIAGSRKLQEILKSKNIGFEYENLSEDKGSTSYAVPNPEQVHILGSKQDIEGFKEFVEQLTETKHTPEITEETPVKQTLEEKLTQYAKEGLPFDEAIKKAGLTKKEFAEVIRDNIYDQFDKFKESLKELNISSTDFSDNIVKGFYNKNGVLSSSAANAMAQLNLIPKNEDLDSKSKTTSFEHNLLQIYLNDWLNTRAINQLLLGDQAVTLQHAVDQIKRGKQQNASHKNIDIPINVPEIGVQKIKRFALFVITDDEQEKSYSEGKTNRTDASMYTTAKGARHIKFGLGELTGVLVRALDKIDTGTPLTSDEVFGINGLIANNGMLNSIKLVHADGQIYVKTAVVILTKQDTSQLVNGEWVAKPNKRYLHNLRVNMEKAEEETGTIAFAAHESAVKMLKQNVQSFEKVMTDDNLFNSTTATMIDAEYMGLQLVNPSNKLEITDPNQLKTLIVSEQKNNTVVAIDHKKHTIDEIIDLYNEAVTHRLELKHINKRNLTFTFDEAMREVHQSLRLGGITPKLESFLRYAMENAKTSGAGSNIIEQFSLDADGNQKYNINTPNLIKKAEQYFLAYFSKGVTSEKIPGHAVALATDKGRGIYRRVYSFDENGQPDKFDVIRENNIHLYDVDFATIINLEETPADIVVAKERLKEAGSKGLIIIDRLRHNLKEYDEKGNYTGQRYAEMVMASHYKEVMDYIENVHLQKTASEIEQEWVNYISVENWSKKSDTYIIRKNIPGFDEARSRKEFAKAKGYKTNNNGTAFIGIDPKVKTSIPDVIAKMFGIRIPSQDKHSAMNIKLVDFLPAYLGSTAVFPRELIEISGADFDIDKLYMHIKEWYYKDGSFQEYGKAETQEQQFDDYLRYIKKQMRKRGNTLYDAAAYFKTYGTSAELTNAIIEDVTDHAIEQNDDEEITPDNPDDVVTETKANVNKELIFVLDLLGLPKTLDEYNKYVKEYGEPYEAALNNKILDYKFALLGNDHMSAPRSNSTSDKLAPIAYEPADIEPLKELWEELQVIVPEYTNKFKEEGIDVDNLLGKVSSWQAVKGASIGAVVLPNLYLSLLKASNIMLRENNSEGELPMLRLNNYTFKGFGAYDNISGDYAIINGQDDIDGHRKQYVISAIITMMTDNAKERFAAKLGLHKNAAAVTVTMLSIGVPLKTAILMVNHPIIRNLYDQAINKKSQSDPGFGELLKVAIAAYTKDVAKTLDKNQDLKSVLYEVTDDLLVNAINGVEDDAQTLSILLEYSKAYKLSSHAAKLSSLMNLTTGYGKDFSSFIKIDKDVAELGLELTNEQFEDTNILFDVRPIFKKGKAWQRTLYRIYQEFSKSLVPSVFLSRTERFMALTNLTLSNMVSGAAMTEEREAKVSNDILAYVTIRAYMHRLEQNNPQLRGSLSNSFIYPSDNSFNINSVINDLKEKTNDDNYFLTYFTYNLPAEVKNNNTGLNVAVSNSFAKLSINQKLKLQNAFERLYGNIETRDGAVHILHYIMVKDGLQYAAGSLLDALSPFIMDNYLDVINSVHNVFKSETETAAFKKVIGVTFNELINEFTINYLKSQQNAYLIKTGYKSGGPIWFSDTEEGKEEETKYIIDLYKGIAPVPQETTKKVRRKILATDINSPEYKKHENYIQDNTGFAFTTISTKEGKIKEIIFPLVVRFRGNDTSAPAYYVLDKVYSSDVRNENIFIEEGMSYVSGSRAEYVKFTPMGAFKQNPIGFMFDTEEFKRPSTREVINFINVKNGKEIMKDDKYELESDDYHTSVPDYGDVDVFNDSDFYDDIDDAMNIISNATNDKITEMLQKGNSGSATVDVDETGIQNFEPYIEEEDPLAEIPEIDIPEQSAETKSKLDMFLNKNNESELVDFWNDNVDLNPTAKEKLMSVNINTLEDFLLERKKTIFTTNASFLEHIKKCIL